MPNNTLTSWQETGCTVTNTADNKCTQLFGRIYEKGIQTRRRWLLWFFKESLEAIFFPFKQQQHKEYILALKIYLLQAQLDYKWSVQISILIIKLLFQISDEQILE